MKLAPPWRQPAIKLMHLLIVNVPRQLSRGITLLTLMPLRTYWSAIMSLTTSTFLLCCLGLLSLTLKVVVADVVAVIGAVVALEDVAINICFVYDLCLLRCLVV